MAEKLVETDWCLNLNSLLKDTKNTEHDTAEKLFDSILTLIDVCKVNFRLSLAESVQKFQKYYEILAKEEAEEDNYFSRIFIKINSILDSLNKNIESKTEL